MKDKEILRRIIRGDRDNVNFKEFQRLIVRYGFELKRVKVSHHIYTHHKINGTLNLQNRKGDAIPYQIKQFLNLVEKHSLNLEDYK